MDRERFKSTAVALCISLANRCASMGDATRCAAAIRVLMLALRLVAVASGCSTDGDALIYDPSSPATNFITGQLIAELARDER